MKMIIFTSGFLFIEKKSHLFAFHVTSILREHQFSDFPVERWRGGQRSFKMVEATKCEICELWYTLFRSFPQITGQEANRNVCPQSFIISRSAGSKILCVFVCICFAFWDVGNFFMLLYGGWVQTWRILRKRSVQLVSFPIYHPPIQDLMVVLTQSLKNNYSLKQVLKVKRWKELYKGRAVMKQKLHKPGNFHRVEEELYYGILF